MQNTMPCVIWMLCVFMISTIHASEYRKHGKSQCYTNYAPYDGDKLNNPIFGGGGFIGQMTGEECEAQCSDPSNVDEHGRQCVAFEHSSQNYDAVANCALAWACDYTGKWNGGATYIRGKVPPACQCTADLCSWGSNPYPTYCKTHTWTTAVSTDSNPIWFAPGHQIKSIHFNANDNDAECRLVTDQSDFVFVPGASNSGAQSGNTFMFWAGDAPGVWTAWNVYMYCAEDVGCGPGNPAPSGCDNQCGSTAVNDECGVCGGSGIPQGECDCNGNVDDECGVCGGSGIPQGECDCNGNINDECGVCGGSGIPQGECDCNGNVDEGCGCGVPCYIVKKGCVCPSGYETIDTEGECAIAASEVLPNLDYHGNKGWGSAPFGCNRMQNQFTFFRPSTSPPQWCNIHMYVICRREPTYVTLTSGTCSTNGYEDIMDVAECKSAAIQTGIANENASAPAVQSENDRPHGCRRQTFGSPLWINDKPNSPTMASEVHTVVCKHSFGLIQEGRRVLRNDFPSVNRLLQIEELN